MSFSLLLVIKCFCPINDLTGFSFYLFKKNNNSTNHQYRLTDTNKLFANLLF